jgi:hypothetical protein
MNAILRNPATRSVCVTCGVPLDSLCFDSSRIVTLANEPGVLEPGRTAILASFELPPQYCGVLEYFFQFTNTQASDPSQIDTPDLEWTIRVNGHPLHPYLAFRHIVNPWGSSSNGPTTIRLDDSSRLEFAVRRLGATDTTLTKVGARLAGRYWYNSAHGR